MMYLTLMIIIITLMMMRVIVLFHKLNFYLNFGAFYGGFSKGSLKLKGFSQFSPQAFVFPWHYSRKKRGSMFQEKQKCILFELGTSFLFSLPCFPFFHFLFNLISLHFLISLLHSHFFQFFLFLV
uniref:Uncharacterized protein n=1 Tax=Cacopsylla melanoneura TaxID=428564 RepID=A0A8D9FDC1_9HEMI